MKTILVLLTVGSLSYMFSDVKSPGFITGFLCPFLFVLSIVALVFYLLSRDVPFSRRKRHSDTGAEGSWVSIDLGGGTSDRGCGGDGGGGD